VTALDDERATTVEDDASADEERFITGTDALERAGVVVYTWRGEHICGISARKATALERQDYEGDLP
jgi:uncharacterized DUF497 family protein